MRRKSWSFAFLALFVLPSVSGCHSAFEGGMAAFHHADYPRAARELRNAAMQGVSKQDGPRYDLYVGLTHLALGNAGPAVIHLRRARAQLDRDPTYFSLAERARIFSAWRSLGKMPGEALVW